MEADTVLSIDSGRSEESAISHKNSAKWSNVLFSTNGIPLSLQNET
jgi:hypothetical protein